MTEKKSDDLELDMGAIAARTPSDRRAGPVLDTSASDDAREGDGEGEDMSETGVREHPVDELLSETESVPDLSEAEKFTLQVKAAFDKTVKIGEDLLRDNELSLRERSAAIEVLIGDIDMQLDKDAIKSDNERVIAGRGVKASLQRTLEYTLQRLCLEVAKATPSTLPVRIQEVSDTELERIALGLGELELKAVTDEGKKEAQRLLGIISGDKTRRASTPRVSVPPPPGESVDERGPTQAVSITPVPQASEPKVLVIIPPAPPAPAPVSGAWQSGPEAQRAADQVVTQPAPPVAPPVPQSTQTPEPSVVLSPSMEAQVKEVKKDENPAPVLRIGRLKELDGVVINDYIIDRPDVSKRHAVLTLLPDGSLKVQDLESAAGTYIDDGKERINQAIIQIGQRVRFASYEVLIAADAHGRPTLVPTDPADKPTGHTDAFTANGDAVSRAHNEERARLQAAGVDQTEPPTTEVTKRPLRSPTEMELDLKGKSKRSWARNLGIGVLAIVALCCLGFGGIWSVLWIADHLPGSGETVADGTSLPKPPEDDTTEETPVASTETETSTSSTPVATADTGYTCRPGREVAGCGRVESFLLATAAGTAYWDCSGVTEEEYRNVYTRLESPTETGHVVANTCACQRCEPTAH